MVEEIRAVQPKETKALQSIAEGDTAGPRKTYWGGGLRVYISELMLTLLSSLTCQNHLSALWRCLFGSNPPAPGALPAKEQEVKEEANSVVTVDLKPAAALATARARGR